MKHELSREKVNKVISWFIGSNQSVRIISHEPTNQFLLFPVT